MRAMFHNAAFLATEIPVFDISEKFGATDMLVGCRDKGAEFARVSADAPVILMRGHGSVAVGADLGQRPGETTAEVARAIWFVMSIRISRAEGCGRHDASVPSTVPCIISQPSAWSRR